MTDIKSVVAQRLRQCRNEKGWLQDEAASRLGVLVSRYSNWEQALRLPKPDTIFKAAEVFGKPAAWLAGYSNVESNPADSLNFISVSKASISVKDTLITLEQVSNDSALNIEYIKRRGLNENKLTTIIAPDDSMAGARNLIKEGDELLIDSSKTEVTKADIFALLINGVVWARWIRPEINGSYTITTEDPDHYPDTNVTKEELDNLKIIGRVSRISRDR
jgi:transcriptional regulator with XRE-family HTH domain